MLTITKEATPAVYSIACGVAKVTEFGDGTILDRIIAMLEKFLPMLMAGCFPVGAKVRFVWSCNHPTRAQQARLSEMVSEQVCGVFDEDQWEVAAELLPIGILDTLRSASNRTLRAAFDEIHKANSAA